MRTKTTKADICVIGGGFAGLCAALSAARHGANVVLMHDRPVLGGNASSEVRVSISGSWFSWDRSVRETGIVEEIMLDTMRWNPNGNWSMWDAILYGKVRLQERLTLLLNCSCVDGEMDGARLRSVRGWQSTNYTWQRVEADLFLDCSGDSILADISGAEVRSGREGKNVFQEPDAPEHGNATVLGSSLVFF